MATVVYDISEPCERLARHHIDQLRHTRDRLPRDLYLWIGTLRGRRDLHRFIDEVLDDPDEHLRDPHRVAVADLLDIIDTQQSRMCDATAAPTNRCGTCTDSLDLLAVETLEEILTAHGYHDTHSIARVDGRAVAVCPPDDPGLYDGRWTLETFLTSGWTQSRPATGFTLDVHSGGLWKCRLTVDRTGPNGTSDTFELSILPVNTDLFIETLYDCGAYTDGDDLAVVIDHLDQVTAAVRDTRFVTFAARAFDDPATAGNTIDQIDALRRIWDTAAAYGATDIALEVSGTCPTDQIVSLLNRLHPAA